MGQKAWADDVAFVLSECVRMQAQIKTLKSDDVKGRVAPTDFMYWLPRPTGAGVIICGKQAWRRIQKLAEVAIKREDPDNTCDFEEVNRRNFHR